MMNKAIVGGILVAVMGGVPGATYLLTTKNSEDKGTSIPKESDSPNPETRRDTAHEPGDANTRADGEAGTSVRRE